ncbi:hypothetical protein ABLB90_10930 [Photorhabdus bodei]|uniref:HNH endonuclease n=1 Tax=Photorhabdus bodei TaxID=2029681 RepID=UPI0032B70FD3
MKLRPEKYGKYWSDVSVSADWNCTRTKPGLPTEVHHVLKLCDLNKPGQRKKPLWAKIMAARRRKTLVVCIKCHMKIHKFRPAKNRER